MTTLAPARFAMNCHELPSNSNSKIEVQVRISSTELMRLFAEFILTGGAVSKGSGDTASRKVEYGKKEPEQSTSPG